MSTPSFDALVEHLGRKLSPARANGLLQAAGGGDKAAFGMLFDWTAPVIFGCIHRAVAERGDAEQLTANVYVGLWRSAPAFEPAGPGAHQRLLEFTRGELLRWHLRQRIPECTQGSPRLPSTD